MERLIEVFTEKEWQERARHALGMAPKNFFLAPVAKSSNRHFAQTLVEHTAAAMKVAKELLSLEQNHELKQIENLVLFSLLIHDFFKYGTGNDVGNYQVLHPLIAAAFVVKNREELMLSKEQMEQIWYMVASHMGEWNTDFKKKPVLPKPKTEPEKFVHLCDYLASRTFIKIEV